MHLIKNGKYAEVKSLCHYNNSWDPDDSIFNQSVRFIHAYIHKYGYPRRTDYRNFIYKDQDNITRIYLDKASLMDTALESAYVEVTYFNAAKDYQNMHSAKVKLFTTFLKIAPPSIDNFYLIKKIHVTLHHANNN